MCRLIEVSYKTGRGELVWIMFRVVLGAATFGLPVDYVVSSRHDINLGRIYCVPQSGEVG